MKTKPLIRVQALVAVALLWSQSPSLALACERCFGAGADSPTVQAIVASMMALFVIFGVVFGGVFSFFNNQHSRTRMLASNPSDPVDNPDTTDR